MKIQRMILKHDEDNEEQKHKESFNTRSAGVLGLASSADQGIREMASVCLCVCVFDLWRPAHWQKVTRSNTPVNVSKHAHAC